MAKARRPRGKEPRRQLDVMAKGGVYLGVGGKYHDANGNELSADEAEKRLRRTRELQGGSAAPPPPPPPPPPGSGTAANSDTPPAGAGAGKG